MGTLTIITARARNAIVASMGGSVKINGSRIGRSHSGTFVYNLPDTTENRDLLIMMRIIGGAGVQTLQYDNDYQLERYLQELDKHGLQIITKFSNHDSLFFGARRQVKALDVIIGYGSKSHR